MRVHLIKKETIRDFIASNAQSKKPLAEWMAKIGLADWQAPIDIQYTFPGADILGNGSGRVVFNIGGNNYRMICKYAFGDRQVHLFVCWIGTHAEYDKLCAVNNQFTISIY